jgi:hypothetical protein
MSGSGGVPQRLCLQVSAWDQQTRLMVKEWGFSHKWQCSDVRCAVQAG